MNVSATLALRFVGRGLRGALRDRLRGLRIVLACLALGVAAIAAVGSLRVAVDRGLASESRRMLGGDFDIDGGGAPLPEALHQWLAARGAQVSGMASMRSLLVAPGGARLLVALRAVDGAYPLVGQVVLNPAGNLAAALPGGPGLDGGLVADPLAIARLHLHVGDVVRLGDARLVLRAALVSVPDQDGGPELLGPPVLISQSALAATGLVQPGSLVNFHLRVVLPPGHAVGEIIAALHAAFPNTGWRIRDRSEASPGVNRAVDQTSLFLVLVGLGALLVGGIGVATGVRAWAEARARMVAILRCLGAASGMILAVFLLEILALCGAGILLGVVAGAALSFGGLALFGDLLPVPAKLGLYPGPLALAALYGALTAAVFALWPLARAMRIPGAALFRDALAPEGRGIGKTMLLVNILLAAILVAVVVATAQDRRFALWFCAGVLAALLVFRAGAGALMRLARLAPRGRVAWLDLGVANLHRPGSGTPLLVVALGLGLAMLSAVALVQGNLRQQVLGQIPRAAPSLFFIDIQNDQLARFRSIVQAIAGVHDMRSVPSLRARIVALKGVPVDQLHVAPGTEWALRGDRGLTYAARLPAGSELVAGHWWPADYAGPPLVSLDSGLAKGWGVGPGDVLRANVLGRDIDFRIASLRKIDWQQMTINYTLVASPGLLEHAPQMHIASLRDAPGSDAVVLAAVTDALPNVTGIPMADVLQALADVVDKLATALAAAGSVTLASGALVLAGGVAAGQRRRMADAVLLKTLGATRAQIRAAWLVEFGLIGAAAGLIAALLGSLASWAVVHFLLQAPWLPLPGVLATILLGCIGLMLGFGYAGTAAALRVPPAQFLRDS